MKKINLIEITLFSILLTASADATAWTHLKQLGKERLGVIEEGTIKLRVEVERNPDNGTYLVYKDGRYLGYVWLEDTGSWHATCRDYRLNTYKDTKSEAVSWLVRNVK